MNSLPARKLLAGILAPLAMLILPASAGALVSEPSSYDWGNVDRYQQSPQQSFKVTNDSGIGVFPQVALSGPDAGQFVLFDNCSGQFFPDGISCSVSVSVNPQTVGPLSASLDVEDGLGALAVPLTANSVTGTLHASPDPIDFNPQPWFWGGQNLQVNVQAQGYGVAISDLELTGPDEALFSINYTDCFGRPLQSFSSCSVGVGFNPTGPSGPAAASLVISSDSEESPKAVAVTATALSGPDEQITPDSKDFGPVALGSASAKQTFSMTNQGDSPDQIQQVFTVAGSPQSFPVSNDECTMKVVMPGETCTFDIAFAPASAGPKEASIFVISSGPSPVTQVGLSGQGYASPGVAALITGKPAVGNSLECDAINANGALTYRWIRDGAVIQGANRSAYEPVEPDFGSRIRCRITVSNPVGTARADSLPTQPVGARDLSKQPHSLVDESACRLVGVDPIGGVRVRGTSPVTPDSPLTFEAARKVDVDLGGITRKGKRVRFTPRRLSGLGDGPVALTVDGRTAQAVLAPCKLSGSVSGSRGGSTTYAVSGATGIRSASLRTPRLSIDPRRRETAQVRVFAYGRPAVNFPIHGKQTTYNGIRVKLSRHRVELRGLFAETSAVRVRFARGVVRGKGGDARAKAELQGEGASSAAFRTAWR